MDNARESPWLRSATLPLLHSIPIKRDAANLSVLHAHSIRLLRCKGVVGEDRSGSRAVDPLPRTIQKLCYRLSLSCRPGPATPVHSHSVPTAGVSKCSKPRVQSVVYSITSSARASSASGMVMPSSFAVFRLTMSLNSLACSAAKSPGAVPFRIWSTNLAESFAIAG